jgi:hypothetical protein
MRDRHDDQDRWNRREGDVGQFGGEYGGTQWGGSQTGGRQGQRGQHTGKGPKGYQRSDDRIREEISDALTMDGDIDASEIEIRVTSGEVVMTGSVDSRQAKRAAEDLAERIQGVKDVRNELRVSRGEHRQSSSEPGRTRTESSSRNR